jgi:hypothetical protein
VHRLADFDLRVPRVHFMHEDDPHLKDSASLSRSKRDYRNSRVVFLVRDPRDVVVSMYHHKRYRSHTFAGEISVYLRQPIGGLESIITYYNLWLENREVPRAFLLLRYEDLHADPGAQLKRVLGFLGLADVRDEVVSSAIRFASFDNMRRLEEAGNSRDPRLSAVDPSEPNSFKVRSGRIGGFRAHFSDDDRRYMDDRIARQLDSRLGYCSPVGREACLDTAPGVVGRGEPDLAGGT